MVVIISIILSVALFTPLEISNVWLRMALHLLLLPVVMGVTYEFNRYVGAHENVFCRILGRRDFGCRILPLLSRTTA